MSMKNLRPAVRFFYDLQKLRIATGLRGKSGPDTAEQTPLDKAFMDKMAADLKGLEADALKHTKVALKGIPVYERWLKHQKGIGPTMAAAIIGAIDIEQCNTPSALWAYAGLGIKNGRAQRRTKGEKLGYNPFLKTKLFVASDCLIRAYSVEEETGDYVVKRTDKKTEVTVVSMRWAGPESDVPAPWRQFYDRYKHRKKTTLVDSCGACKGTGEIKKEPCSNCGATGGPAPWGNSCAHRDQAARRYMMKQFLLCLWLVWRKLENLPTRVPYQEQMQGKSRHDPFFAGFLPKEFHPPVSVAA